MMRQSWIDKGDAVALTWQCALAGVSRATVYVRQKPKLIALDDEMLKGLIDEEYTRHPFYGSRKMVVYLGRCGHRVNRKRTQRLMRCMGLAGMALDQANIPRCDPSKDSIQIGLRKTIHASKQAGHDFTVFVQNRKITILKDRLLRNSLLLASHFASSSTKPSAHHPIDAAMTVIGATCSVF